MREIKFRAWDARVNQMLGWSTLDSFNLKALNDERYKAMQYTGLKDKNGKEIYENDILMWNDIDQIEVKWGEGSSYEGGAWSGYRINSDDQHQLEVIGNIHENPNLLES